MTKQSKLPKAALKFFREQGKIGGRRRAEALTAEERSKQARDAVNARWKKQKAKNSGKGKAK